MQLLADVAMLKCTRERRPKGQPRQRAEDLQPLVPQARRQLAVLVDRYHATFPGTTISMTGAGIFGFVSARAAGLEAARVRAQQEAKDEEAAQEAHAAKLEQDRQATEDRVREQAQRVLAKEKAAEDQMSADQQKYRQIQVRTRPIHTHLNMCIRHTYVPLTGGSRGPGRHGAQALVFQRSALPRVEHAGASPAERKSPRTGPLPAEKRSGQGAAGVCRHQRHLCRADGDVPAWRHRALAGRFRRI
jgi:hypothetical protein